MKARESALLAVATGATVGLTAAFLRAPNVLFADSGELLTAVATKGVAHPPGFPLYLLLGGLFLDLTGGAGPTAASRLNLFSALSTGVAAAFAVLAALVAIERTELAGNLDTVSRRVLAMVAGLLCGFGPTLFDFSLGTEVYGLHAAFLAAALAAALAAGNPGITPRDASRLTFLTGLAVGCGLGVHHATMVVMMPGLAVLLWGGDERPARLRRVGLFAAGLVPGLLTYVVLPIRAAGWPALNWGNPSNPFRFWVHISARDYQVNIENDLGTILEHAARFLDSYRAEFTALGLVLALLAGALIRGAGRLAVPGLFVVILGDIAFAVRYEIAEDQAAYYIPTFVATSILVVLGSAALAARLESLPRRRAAVGIVTALALVLVVWNVKQKAGRRFDDRAAEAARNAFASIPEGALVLTSEWNLYAPMVGLRQVAGERRDAILIDVLLLRRGWYLDAWKRKYPERHAEIASDFDTYRTRLADWEEGRPFDSNLLTSLYNKLTQQMARKAWERGAKVVWLGTLMPEHVPGNSAIVPSGTGYRVLASREEAQSAEIPDAPVSTVAAVRPGLPYDQVFEEKIGPLTAQVRAQRALYELGSDRITKARAAVDEARRLRPSDAFALEVEGDICLAEDNPARALELFTASARFGGQATRLAEKTRIAQGLLSSPSPR